eukprot:15462935-Alexandrium_andersonii.AAC.1
MDYFFSDPQIPEGSTAFDRKGSLQRGGAWTCLLACGARTHVANAQGIQPSACETPCGLHHKAMLVRR